MIEWAIRQTIIAVAHSIIPSIYHSVSHFSGTNVRELN
ncbi:hypothetical protein CLV58_12725 [Spirosoma oryzae]|uniref:Uncharacterized protein n=1 Tax=Spirosoma oryzae TaxID=1469603 RepID=A0A2T0S6N8_9BACT|nr:hypothetical protein CLV58_12725 [Spirosoma oryzae]